MTESSISPITSTSIIESVTPITTTTIVESTPIETKLNLLPPLISTIPCMNCGKPANKLFTCVICKAEERRDALFCTKECYADNWKTHKKFHNKKKPTIKEYNFPPGTQDGFKNKVIYTGDLRAVYPIVPVPKRELPSSIPRPDYASHPMGVSVSETRGNLAERFGRVLNPIEIEGMREVCRLGREVLDLAAQSIKVGITTLEIDEIVHLACKERNAYPSPLGYHQFPRSVCTSVNEVICHGIPDARPLEDGDIINIDVTLFYNGFHGDLNATYPVGTKVTPENLNLMETARECLDESIRVCKPGFPFKKLGEIISRIALRNGCTTNKTYYGHGINQLFHCAPNVPHYAGNNAKGTMVAGMTFTIEPMICAGHHQEEHWKDNWTAVTKDGKASAQYEETLLITETGVEVLTKVKGWTLPVKPRTLFTEEENSVLMGSGGGGGIGGGDGGILKKVLRKGRK